MKGTISKRQTRSQTLKKRLAEAVAREGKVADIPAPLPPPEPQFGKINRVSTKRARTQPLKVDPLGSRPFEVPPLKEPPSKEPPWDVWDFLLGSQQSQQSQFIYEGETASYLYRYKPSTEVLSGQVPAAHHSRQKPQPSLARPFDPNLKRTLFLNWLGSVGSDRNIRHCRSDSHLQLRPTNDNDHHISGHTPVSASAINLTQNFPGPMTRTALNDSSMGDTNTQWVHPLETSIDTAKRDKYLVKQPSYRENNLGINNISMRGSDEKLPNQVTNLINLVYQVRDVPPVAEINGLHNTWLSKFGTQMKVIKEPQVRKHFGQDILPAENEQDSLQRDDEIPMNRHIVPNPTPSYRVSTPIPDVLFGYNGYRAFLDQYFQILPLVEQAKATSTASLYPFLVFKFKGDEGSMWVATNQCLGASASCVNVAENLNHILEKCESNKIINSATFSVASNGTEARLYVTWKHDEDRYYTITVRAFSLYDFDHYVELYNCIHNILDWGRGQRLQEIREAVDIILKGGRKRAAKSRASPSELSGSDNRVHKRPKRVHKRMPNSRIEEAEPEVD